MNLLPLVVPWSRRCRAWLSRRGSAQRGLLRQPRGSGGLHVVPLGQAGLLRDPQGKSGLAVAPSAQSGLLRHPSGRGPWPPAPLGQSGLLRQPQGSRGLRPVPLGQGGFTLIEIMIVLSIVGILMTIAEPSYRNQIIKAREAALKKDLFVVRDVLDQFAADQGRYPDGLQELVDQKYLRGLPTDPFTRAADTWIEVREEVSDGQETAGVFDLHSGSNLVASDGTAYNEW